jgi:TIR domain
MAFVSNFKADIFISYKHSDNQAGWVSEFHRRLHVRLTELLGQEAVVWRDKKLGGADAFSDEILEQLRNTALFVPVVTPGYMVSEWCQKELVEFQNAAAKTGGLRVGNKLRMVKAVKTPMDGDEHRKFQGDSLGYEFYERFNDSADFREFHPDMPAYKDKLDSMAQEICRILRAMRSQKKQEERSSLAVYVAETTGDLKAQRERIVDELKGQGYRVLPETELPDDDEGCELACKEAMEQVSLSIHLFGPKYKTAASLQYQVAAGRGIARVVWLSTEAKSAAGAQAKFLETLLSESQNSPELLENRTIEELKEVVLDKLKVRPAETPAAGEDQELVRVYLVCDRDDHPLLNPEPNTALQLRDYLFDHEGFEVKLPATAQTSAPEVRKDNREKLMQCDAVLLYWGNASELWVDEKLRELAQAVGWRRARFAAKGIFATDPRSPIKQGFKTREATVIHNFQSFSGDVLESFVAPLRRKGHAAAGGQ